MVGSLYLTSHTLHGEKKSLVNDAHDTATIKLSHGQNNMFFVVYTHCHGVACLTNVDIK